jgi:hypothetical protein
MKKSLDESVQGYCDYGVETCSERRRESGPPHHHESEKLMTAIADLDFWCNDDMFCFRTGGDGDNGEALMFLMDAYFELQDKINEELLSELPFP